MKVRLLLEVDAHARYVIARYLRQVDGTATYSRATRAQVRRFAEAALRLGIREQADALSGKAAGTARRLKLPPGHRTAEIEELRPPRERQREFLLW